MLIPTNETRQRESSHGNTVVRACCRVATHGCTLQVQNLSQAEMMLLSLEGKDCKGVGRRVSASGSGQEPRAPHANSVLIRFPHHL
jgi:hypothetical protein